MCVLRCAGAAAIIGASVSEPPLVDSTAALSRYIDRYNWGRRERAPTLLMSMEIMYVRTCVRTEGVATRYVRPAGTSDRQTVCANVVRILLTLLVL